MPDHRHERHDAAPAGDERNRTSLLRGPREVPADRSAQLDPVARPQLARQERRDLAVLEALDRERDTVLPGRRCDRVATLCLVSVLGRESYVYVLAGLVSSACHRDGLITLTAGTYGNVLRFLPPLVIGDALLAEGLDILDAAFAATA